MAKANPLIVSFLLITALTSALAVVDKCKSPTPFCGKSSGVRCFLRCAYDPDCSDMGYNITNVPCGCACQICDGVIYRDGVPDHTKATPLSPEEVKTCLHVTHPCKSVGAITE